MGKRGFRFILLAVLFFIYTGGIVLAQKVSPQINPKITSSRICKTCHEEIFDHWKQALHSRSWDNPTFLVSYFELYFKTRGGAKFDCLPCHAPATRINSDFDLNEEVTKEGVTCDFCHSIKGIDHAESEYSFQFESGGIKWGPIADLSSPAHETQDSELFTSSELCAGCHEYINANGIAILGTYSEWKAGPYAEEDIQCQDCHMPLVEGDTVKEGITSAGRSSINLHAIKAGHSIEQLKKVLLLDIKEINRKADSIEVIVEVTNSGAGHMVPTGIPTRKLILWAELKTPGDSFSQKREYQRVLLDKQGNILTKVNEMFEHTAEVSLDTRIKPGETKTEMFVFPIPEARQVRITARVEYQYRFNVLKPREFRIKMAEVNKRLRSRE